MYQLALDIRTGEVKFKKVEIVKETKLCFFFNTSTTVGCIYRFEKDRLNKVEDRWGNYSIFFQDLDSFPVVKDLLLDKASIKYERLMADLKIVNDGMNKLNYMEVPDEYKEAKQETGE